MATHSRMLHLYQPVSKVAVSLPPRRGLVFCLLLRKLPERFSTSMLLLLLVAWNGLSLNNVPAYKALLGGARRLLWLVRGGRGKSCLPMGQNPVLLAWSRRLSSPTSLLLWRTFHAREIQCAEVLRADSTRRPFVRRLFGRTREGLYVDTRRSMLKAGMAGMAGLSLPGLLQAKAEAAAAGTSGPTGKSVILLWMAGGPSHIDTWDSKPEQPWINRGPFGVTKTKLPGVVICEHLPKQAAMLDKFTIIRSVDARHSNHEPNMVFQTANLAAEPRVNPEAVKYP